MLVLVGRFDDNVIERNNGCPTASSDFRTCPSPTTTAHRHV